MVTFLVLVVGLRGFLALVRDFSAVEWLLAVAFAEVDLRVVVFFFMKCLFSFKLKPDYTLESSLVQVCVCIDVRDYWMRLIYLEVLFYRHTLDIIGP